MIRDIKLSQVVFPKTGYFQSEKGTVQMKRHTTEGERIFAKHASVKGLVSKIQELLKLNNKKTKNPIKSAQNP